MGSKSQTTTQKKVLSPELQGAYADLTSKATGALNTPYTPYTGQLTAGATPLQQQGYNTIGSLGNVAQPYINQASQYTTQGAAPITTTPFSAQAVQQYESPYTQDVVNATEAQLRQQDQQQQNAAVGNAVSAGAYGGDRSAMLQAALGGQQDIANNATIANLYNQNYGQALGQFNTQNQLGLNTQEANAQNAQTAAFTEGNLGSLAQNAAYAAPNAQIAAGTQQQQTQQAGLDAQYQQYLNQQNYPYAQLQSVGSALSGAANATGGTQTTQPGPSLISQIAGVGLTAAGLGWTPFKKHGGRLHDTSGIGFAGGGEIGSDDYEGDGPSTVPTDTLADLSGLPREWAQMATHSAQPPSSASQEYVPPKPDWHQAALTAGLATLGGNSPFALTNIGQGGLAGLKEYQNEEDLDRHPTVDNSGPTQRIFYPSEKKWIDTGIPTTAAMTARSAAADRADTLAERAQNHQDTIAQRREAADQAAKDRAAQIDVARMNAGAGRFSIQPGLGVDPATGKQVPGAYVFNQRTGQPEFKAGVVVTPRGAGASQSAWQWKYDAWLKTHPNDEQGALDFVAGHRTMGPAEAMKFAISEAAKENPGATKEEVDARAGEIAAKLGAAQGARPAAATKIPPRPAGVPAGSAYSASRKMWRDASGKHYDESGKLIAGSPAPPEVPVP